MKNKEQTWVTKVVTLLIMSTVITLAPWVHQENPFGISEVEATDGFSTELGSTVINVDSSPEGIAKHLGSANAGTKAIGDGEGIVHYYFETNEPVLSVKVATSYAIGYVVEITEEKTRGRHRFGGYGEDGEGYYTIRYSMYPGNGTVDYELPESAPEPKPEARPESETNKEPSSKPKEASTSSESTSDSKGNSPSSSESTRSTSDSSSHSNASSPESNSTKTADKTQSPGNDSSQASNVTVKESKEETQVDVSTDKKIEQSDESNDSEKESNNDKSEQEAEDETDEESNEEKETKEEIDDTKKEPATEDVEEDDDIQVTHVTVASSKRNRLHPFFWVIVLLPAGGAGYCGYFYYRKKQMKQ